MTNDLHGVSERPVLESVTKHNSKQSNVDVSTPSNEKSGHWGRFDPKTKTFPMCPLSMSLDALNELLSKLYLESVDDVVFQVDNKVFCKQGNTFYPVTVRPLRVSEVSDILSYMHRESTVGKVRGGSYIDFPYAVPIVSDGMSSNESVQYARFRVNSTACMGLFGSRDSLDITMRCVPAFPSTMDELGLPDGIKQLAFPSSGLILVTGETGSGKSTTLGAFIRHLAEQPKGIRIITYEDPIEYDFRAIPNLTAIIAQTSVGSGEMVPDWDSCIPNALRRNPNVIMLGEIRTPESIKNALTAARSGHVVYTTVHAEGVASTFNRIVNIFPETEQRAVLEALVSTVRGVIHQRLLTTKDQRRQAVFEWLEVDRYERDQLQAVEGHQIFSTLQTLVEKRGRSLLQDLQSKKEQIIQADYLATYRSLTDRYVSEDRNDYGEQ